MNTQVQGDVTAKQVSFDDHLPCVLRSTEFTVFAKLGIPRELSREEEMAARELPPSSCTTKQMRSVAPIAQAAAEGVIVGLWEAEAGLAEAGRVAACFDSAVSPPWLPCGACANIQQPARTPQHF